MPDRKRSGENANSGRRKSGIDVLQRRQQEKPKKRQRKGLQRRRQEKQRKKKRQERQRKKKPQDLLLASLALETLVSLLVRRLYRQAGWQTPAWIPMEAHQNMGLEITASSLVQLSFRQETWVRWLCQQAELMRLRLV